MNTVNDHASESGRRSLWGFIYKSTNPTYESSASLLKHLAKAPPLNTIIFKG